MRQPCPIDGCIHTRSADQAMCRRHWFQVPKPLRDDIWRLYRDNPRSIEHIVALGEAIEFVNDQAVNA